MPKRIDLTGEKFGRLTVISRDENDKYRCSHWRCRCDCGREKVISISNLRSGGTQSCGCLMIERTREKSTTHGMRNTRLYHIWISMKQRCNNRNNHAYKHYGGRGITICSEWLDKEKGFINFYNWAMANGYADSLSIDRINPDGNYEPSNCRWANAQEQTDNRRCSKTFAYAGVKYKSISDASRQLGIHYMALWRTKQKEQEKDENGN